jgi:hypothetical protein
MGVGYLALGSKKGGKKKSQREGKNFWGMTAVLFRTSWVSPQIDATHSEWHKQGKNARKQHIVKKDFVNPLRSVEE